MRKRTCIVRFSVELLQEMPDYKTPDDIVNYFNESTYCMDNAATQIELAMKVNCLCDIATVDFVREATAEDEKRHGYVNEDF